MVKLTVLTENTVRQAGLLAEHGLSFWIETDRQKILFDTGQSDVFIKNAHQLGIEPGQADSIVISHGHYDHADGLPHLVSRANQLDLYIHADAFVPKYAMRQGEKRYIGIGWDPAQLENQGLAIHRTGAVTKLDQQVTLLAQIQKGRDIDKPAKDLLVMKDSQLLPDPMSDEQILICKTAKGLLVLLGCSHPGVVNCLDTVRQSFPNDSIHTVIGGLHLEKASPENLDAVIGAMKSMDIQSIIPIHCTGQASACRMKQVLGSKVEFICTGDTLVIE